MSKHKRAEQKLRISRQLQPDDGSMRKRAAPGTNAGPSGPPKGNNSNNQFR